MKTRHGWLALLVGAATFALSIRPAVVQAQDYPNRPVKILVGAPPGGSTDIIARLMAQKLSERLGQPFVVENRAGANMIIASETAARATPDGHTLIMVPSNHVINGGLYSKLAYDPIKDFAPIARLANLPLMVVVHPSLPVNSMTELIAYTKMKKRRPRVFVLGHRQSASLGHGASHLHDQDPDDPRSVQRSGRRARRDARRTHPGGQGDRKNLRCQTRLRFADRGLHHRNRRRASDPGAHRRISTPIL